ncbi:TetR/AcrR family transcriptional regulator [Leifsonia kafniensis]|uniref:TetR/AcrR family transcriptional regulator n=1 Tax=Leifsonia kafniensis TaxID=475957 RepID=A0ABP7K8B8_9MICO
MRAAGRLMLHRGYVATSINSIATEAGVAVQTIYNSVGSKAELLSAVLELAAEGPGTQELVPAALRKRVLAASSAVEILRVVADWFLAVNERTVNVVLMISQAAAVDGDVAAVERRSTASRLHTCGEVATSLRAVRGLRGGMSDPEAAAAIWAVGHPQVYRMLVSELGWSSEAYRDWLEKALRGALS